MRRDDLVPAMKIISFPPFQDAISNQASSSHTTPYTQKDAVNFLPLSLLTSRRTCAHVITQTSRDRSGPSTVINVYVTSRPAAVMWCHVACAPRVSHLTLTLTLTLTLSGSEGALLSCVFEHRKLIPGYRHMWHVYVET